VFALAVVMLPSPFTSVTDTMLSACSTQMQTGCVALCNGLLVLMMSQPMSNVTVCDS
jgi:hypothetical protein